MCVSSLVRSESSAAVWPPEFGTTRAPENHTSAAPGNAPLRGGVVEDEAAGRSQQS